MHFQPSTFSTTIYNGLGSYGAYGDAPTTYNCIRKGATGAVAEKLGELLKDQGHLSEDDYYTAQDDFDANIDTALRAFQADQGLKVDGVAGPNTWAKLGIPKANTQPCPQPVRRGSSTPTKKGTGDPTGAGLKITEREWFWPVAAGVVVIALAGGIIFWPKGD
jgi:peptidoglycan hydrolase-like protein with peptidoglycan-binding domain